MSLILLIVGGIYLFGGLDKRAGQSGTITETEKSSFAESLPLFIPGSNPGQQKIWYGAILLCAGALFFIGNKRKEVAGK